jgi:hypothetical protein
VGPAPAAAAASAIPEDILGQYEAVRKALLADDDNAAATAARALAAGAGADADLSAAAVAIAEAADLSARRARFGDLSRLLVLRLGGTGSSNVVVYHCPMVTEGYGYWLQAERGIGNPYMGTSMPRCGGESSLRAALKAAAR